MLETLILATSLPGSKATQQFDDPQGLKKAAGNVKEKYGK